MRAFLVIGMLGPLARDLSQAAAQAGWVPRVQALACAVLCPVTVSLTAGLARRKAVAAGMASFGAGALGSVLAPSIEVLSAMRLVAAAGAG